MNWEKRSLYTCLSSFAHRFPDRGLLGDETGWLSASDVLSRSLSAASSLRQYGVRRGTLVTLCAKRCVSAAVLLFGLRFLGAVAVLCDPRERAEDALGSCDAVIDPAFTAEITPDGSALLTRLSDGAGLSLSLLRDIPCPPAFSPVSEPQAPSFVLFTSGSTGKKKAVVLSEDNLIMDLLATEPMGLYRPDDVALGALPLDHVFGLVLLVGGPVLGYGIYFPDRTDVCSLLSAIRREGITRMNGVPSLYLRLAQQAEENDCSSLRAGFIAGGPVTASQFMYIEKSLGLTLISVYGMTECVGITCSDYRDPQAVRAGGVGSFYAVNDGFILAEDGQIAPAGQIGEICVRGPMRMLGYYGEPLPAAAFLHTGDLGFLDEDGVLHLCGRKKDIIIRNGNNLSAVRIEQALLSLPGVQAAAVVGMPDEMQGEVPCAMIVGRADREALTPRLHKNEIPVKILSVPVLPMTSLGKPDKQAIREAMRR